LIKLTCRNISCGHKAVARPFPPFHPDWLAGGGMGSQVGGATGRGLAPKNMYSRRWQTKKICVLKKFTTGDVSGI